MPAWLSPFSLSSEQEQALAEAGWQRWDGALQNLPSDGALVYDTPDQLLALGTDALLEGYLQLQDPALFPRAVAAWRLLQPDAEPFPAPEPLPAALAYALLSASPGLLDAYLDLELKANLRGGDPDVAYKRRLLAAIDPGAVISSWQELQHHDPEPLETATEELQARNAELQDAREEAELILLQLHQVQEELEHYFLLSRGQSQQLERYNQLQQRSQRLLARVAAGSAARV